MDVNKLVESIVRPFLEETNMQYDNCVVPVENNECVDCGCGNPTDDHQNQIKEFRDILGMSMIEPIQLLTKVVDDYTINNFIKSHPEEISWEDRSQEMADKLGYKLIDFIDGEDQITNPEINVPLDDENTFMDVTGTMCENFSIRQKLKSIVNENLKKKLVDESPDAVIANGSLVASFNEECITFILDKSYVLYMPGSTHANMVNLTNEYLRRNLPDQKWKKSKIHFSGDQERFRNDVENCDSKIYTIGQLNGRLWPKKNLISFWNDQETVKKNLSALLPFLKIFNIDYKSLNFDYSGEFDINRKIAAQRAGKDHATNRGTMYLTKDKNIKSPEESRWEKMLLRMKKQ